jgi:hypothetical protein
MTLNKLKKKMTTKKDKKKTRLESFRIIKQSNIERQN